MAAGPSSRVSRLLPLPDVKQPRPEQSEKPPLWVTSAIRCPEARRPLLPQIRTFNYPNESFTTLSASSTRCPLLLAEAMVIFSKAPKTNETGAVLTQRRSDRVAVDSTAGLIKLIAVLVFSRRDAELVDLKGDIASAKRRSSRFTRHTEPWPTEDRPRGHRIPRGSRRVRSHHHRLGSEHLCRPTVLDQLARLLGQLKGEVARGTFAFHPPEPKHVPGGR